MLRRREIATWNALVDAVLVPPAPLPPAAATTAARNLDAMLRAASTDNRTAIHALVRVAALLGPARVLPALRHGALGDLVRTLAASTYYEDDGVQRRLGHDPDAVLARVRA
jgi:hypothetical protein